MQPQVRQRPLSARVMRNAEAAGYTPLQARILAGRLRDDEADDLQRRVSPRLSSLDGPAKLPDIELATERLVRAIVDQETVVAACDFDCDGVSSMCVIQTAFLQIFGHPKTKFHPFIGLRMRDGYGLSDNLVDRIFEQAPETTLVVTSDQGSADQNRISLLRARGIDTVVTDHHGIPEAGPPADAVACVNPVRLDSEFSDKCIAGVNVAFLTMCAVRERLIKMGVLDAATPSLAHLADFVCLGTVADAVSFARSHNNRAITIHGLSLMNASNPRPCWAALRQHLKKVDAFTSTDLAFGAAPLVNSAGRLADAMMGVRYLMAPTVAEAAAHLAVLDAANRERRDIEARLRATALPIAEQAIARGATGVVVFLEDGHPGVHGVTAARVVETLGRPAVCFSPKPDNPEIITGSFRSVPGIHIRDCLAEVHQEHPDIQIGFGGHAGAAGSHLLLKDLERFTEAFDAAVAKRAAGMKLAPTIWVDGELPDSPGLQHLPEISALGPYGREFDMPVFTMPGVVTRTKAVGDGTHLQLGIRDTRGRHHNAIWFRAVSPGDAPPVAEGDLRSFAFELGANTFRGETTAQLKIVGATPAN